LSPEVWPTGGVNPAARLDTAEAYNPSTNTWSTIAPLPTARRDLAAAAAVLEGIGYVFAIGGHGAELELALATTEVYGP
jgi:Kelch motif